MSLKVLLVEDDKNLHEVVKESLGHEFDVVGVTSAHEALQQVKEHHFAIAIADVNLPDSQGFGLCKKLKAESRTLELPVLYLTGMASVSDRVTGLTSGAEDYILKPFHPDELLARVRVHSRAVSNSFGRMRVSWELQKVFIEENGAERDAFLTPVEFRILACILRAPDRLVSRHRLLDVVWGRDVNVGSRSVDRHVCTLRRKLGPCSSYILTVHNEGYRFKYETDN